MSKRPDPGVGRMNRATSNVSITKSSGDQDSRPSEYLSFAPLRLCPLLTELYISVDPFPPNKKQENIVAATKVPRALGMNKVTIDLPLTYSTSRQSIKCSKSQTHRGAILAFTRHIMIRLSLPNRPGRTTIPHCSSQALCTRLPTLLELQALLLASLSLLVKPLHQT
jgi:hypothetical protein